MSTRSTGAARQTLPDSRPAPKRGREPESPDTPTSPPRSAGPLTRKRAASLRTDPRIEDLSLNTPAAASSSSHHPVEKIRERELICLCTPAPKVPRPRNGMSYPSFLSSLSHVFLPLLPQLLSGLVFPNKSPQDLSPFCKRDEHPTLLGSYFLCFSCPLSRCSPTSGKSLASDPPAFT